MCPFAPSGHRWPMLIATLTATVAVLAGCGPQPAPDDPAGRFGGLEPTPPTTAPADARSATPSPAEFPKAERPKPADRTDEDTDAGPETARDADADRSAVGDCAAYRDASGWCRDGIGDYDCEGGQGNGPNYAPRGVRLVQPGNDPFGLDRDDDGEGCEDAASPPPPPPDPDPPPPDPGTDPRFGTCREAIAAGYGPYYRGQDPEYDWYRDADGDGVVCE